MASEEGCVTIVWEIANFDFFLKVDELLHFSSPAWKVENDDEGIAWGMLIVVHGNFEMYFNKLWLGQSFPVDRCEMSLISSCGEVPLLEVQLTRGGEHFVLNKGDLLDQNRQSILPDDTLTLCCRMRGNAMKTSEIRISSVLRSFNYLWNIEELRSSDLHDTVIEQDNFPIYLRLKRKVEEDTYSFSVKEVHRVDCCCYSFVYCKLPFEDGRGRVIDETLDFPFLKWLCDINIFPNNTSITLPLKSVIAFHKSRQDSCALANDLLQLYRESALSDATLNAEGKSFSAHRSILAARSPVFRAMFEKDEMSEGRSGVVDIDDVDSETVGRLLVFLYGDSLGDLQWKEASALYYAADKYDVPLLKEKGAAILKAGLTEDNACDALVLADKHSDQELEKCVVNFILEHEEVVSSDQWKQLEKNNSPLAAKIAGQLFLKKGKK